MTATAETCDGKDNNCNGLVDDGAPGAGVACTTTNTPACGGGFSAPGKTRCEAGGKIVCEATPCNTSDPNATDCYCSIAGAANGGNGAPCGVPGATRCTPGVDRCIPNAVCAGASGDELCRRVPECPTFPACWTPKDLNMNAATCK